MQEIKSCILEVLVGTDGCHKI